ncbi:MAG: hypothetical protein V3W14_02565, partial [Candidatus Neomarinimicrobiota bacterium]
DSGLAWTPGSGHKPRPVITYGWGPRFILFGLPIQLDYAYQVKPPPGEKRRHWYLTIGLDF